MVFGSYDDSDLYMRNRVLASAFAARAADVTYLRPTQRAVIGTSERTGTGWWRLALTQLRNLSTYWRERHCLRAADVVFIPYPAYADVFLLRTVAPLAKFRLVVDAFLDLYDTVVHDRKIASERSALARLVSLGERTVLRSADHVLVDSPGHAQALVARYGLHLDAVTVVPVGLDEDVWRPLPRPVLDGRLRVLFWGTFIPLHGVDVIVEAARILADEDPQVLFRLIGDGQTGPEIATLLAQVRLPNLSWERNLVSTESLRAATGEAHVVLGVFGRSEKAGNVVPYKVHQALASDRPVVTRHTSHLAEIQCPGLTLVPPGDGRALADALTALRASLARGDVAPTRPCYEANFGSRVIARAIDSVLARVGGLT